MQISQILSFLHLAASPERFRSAPCNFCANHEELKQTFYLVLLPLFCICQHGAPTTDVSGKEKMLNISRNKGNPFCPSLCLDCTCLRSQANTLQQQTLFNQDISCFFCGKLGNSEVAAVFNLALH